MKKVFFATYYPPHKGGSGVFMEQIASAFQDVGYVLPRGSNAPGNGKLLYDLYPPHRSRIRSWLSIFFANLRITFSHAFNRTVVIYSKVYDDSLGSIPLLLNKRISYCVMAHGEDIGRLLYLKRRRGIGAWIKYHIIRYILSRALIIICNSNHTRQLITRMDPALHEKCRVVYPSFSGLSAQHEETDHPRNPKLRSLPRSGFVLSVGRVDAQYKGFDKLIEALRQIDNPEVRLVIAGSGNYDYLESLVGPELESRVILAGEVDDQDLRWLYRHCRFFALPGRSEEGFFEGFGIVFLEAAIFAKPYICGQLGGAKEIHQDSDFGIEVDGASSRSIADAVQELWRSTDLAEKGERAQSACTKRFSQDAQKERVFESFKDILVKQPG